MTSQRRVDVIMTSSLRRVPVDIGNCRIHDLYALYKNRTRFFIFIWSSIKNCRLHKHISHGDEIKWKLFCITEPLWGESTAVSVGFPSQRPVTRSFDVYFDLRLNKRVIRQSRRWWFETAWRSLFGTQLGMPSPDKIWRHAALIYRQWPLLLTWFNFNPGMDIYVITPIIMCGMKLLIHS